ncbi:hypothetical protein PtA15_5A94 [Puccinia triticina]|uniref:Mediator of RNA polymerase II transcription subunit 5 n=1 Tax=Puccinia triticina TaxID=208348 RepID=A0ABY7CGZ2_9BASI|nr:uncharacterized protein PtA15_5A94 [Puccinia triticina]WAQ84524.1 hypothetical protein PtA15_5A94 [Puccinia triticina]
MDGFVRLTQACVAGGVDPAGWLAESRGMVISSTGLLQLILATRPPSARLLAYYQAAIAAAAIDPAEAASQLIHASQPLRAALARPLRTATLIPAGPEHASQLLATLLQLTATPDTPAPPNTLVPTSIAAYAHANPRSPVRDILHAALSLPATCDPSNPHEDADRRVWTALLAGGRLPELIRTALPTHPELCPADLLGLQQSLNHPRLWPALHAALVANRLAEALPDPSPAGHLDLGLQPLLDALGKDIQTPPAALARLLHQTLETAAATFDLATCMALTTALSTLGGLGVLGSEFESFGALLGWLQGVVGRFNLMDDLEYHLDTQTGFTLHYITSPSTAYATSELPATHESVMRVWIEALYGSSGIPDALLGSTDPRIFFATAATIVKQSFDALAVGRIDLQTFRDGLSYFEHKLLIGGAAVGVVGWILDELTRLGPFSPTDYPTALLEILQAILLSDAISPTALRLVGARSLGVIRAYDGRVSSPVAVLLPPDDAGLGRRVQLDVAGLEQRLTELPASEMEDPAGFLAHDFGPGTDWPTALTMAVHRAPHSHGRPTVRVQKAWDAARYHRVHRAVSVAVDVLTWPAPPARGPAPLPVALLDQLFGRWGDRLAAPAGTLEDALVERDIVLACLARLDAWASSHPSPPASEDEPGNPVAPIDAARFREMCVTSLRAQKLGPAPPRPRRGARDGLGGACDGTAVAKEEGPRRESRPGLSVGDGVIGQADGEAEAEGRVPEGREEPGAAGLFDTEAPSGRRDEEMPPETDDGQGAASDTVGRPDDPATTREEAAEIGAAAAMDVDCEPCPAPAAPAKKVHFLADRSPAAAAHPAGHGGRKRRKTAAGLDWICAGLAFAPLRHPPPVDGALSFLDVLERADERFVLVGLRDG